MDLLIFDIDDTLTQTATVYQNIFAEGLKELGVKKKNHLFNNFRHHTDSFIAKEIYEEALGKSFDKRKLIEFENILHRKIESINIIEIEGAKRTITELQKNTEIAVCFATGSFLKPAIYKLNEIGVIFENSLLVASNNFHSREEILYQAISNAKLFYKKKNFDRIISIGDGIWDLECANNLDIEFIGIGPKNKEKLSQKGMKKHFDNLINFSF